MYPHERIRAGAAQHVYNNSGKLVGGWQESYVYQYNIDNKISGMQSTMYERIKADGTREYAYVYAGTDATKANDWNNNILQKFGKSVQYRKASVVAQEINAYFGKGNELTFVGHSLGGGLSTLSSLITGRTSISFNPAWISEGTLSNINNSIRSLEYYGGHRTSYCHENDPLTSLQDKYGADLDLVEINERVEVDGGFWSNFVEGHMMGEMIDRFEENRENFQHTSNRDDSIGRENDDGSYEVSRSPRYQ